LLAGTTILVVDDEYGTRKTIRALLLALGCRRIHEADDARSGLEAARAFDPDIVLLNWKMPGIGGAEFVRRLRSDSSSPHPNIAAVMLTERGEYARVLEAMRLGIHEFVLKPISRATLKARLLSVLANSRRLVGSSKQQGYAPPKLAS
jgi:DNA-binding NarL/FixJ family response regulator